MVTLLFLTISKVLLHSFVLHLLFDYDLLELLNEDAFWEA